MADNDWMEHLESDVIEMRKTLERVEVGLAELTKYVSRTEYNRISRLSKRVKELEKAKEKKK